MSQSEVNLCPTLRPTRKQFERPFSEYVRQQFKLHPEWACFKVIPPSDWKPRRRKSYGLENILIQTPIKQHVFGKGGAYRCIFVEERSTTAAEFESSVRKSGAASPPARSRGSKVDDAFMERPFWSSVTINPPLYGADTPLSLFDRKLAYGWNLRHLDCLLSEYDVPDIPGVTSPMTYFGSWKSFFGWHKEDIDLYSINFLHSGEAKIWYCISPSDAAKFEALARGLFPDLHARCPAFMRHKDIMISPKLLRAHAVPFVQARQEPGEFVVLNAAAYHSGYNMGFNIAEAVNFALPEWLHAGRDAVNCECAALPDSVTLDMGIFFPDLRQEEDEDEEEDEDDEEEEEEAGSRASQASSSSSRASQTSTSSQLDRPRAAKRGKAAAPDPPQASSSDSSDLESEVEPGGRPGAKRARPGRPPKRQDGPSAVGRTSSPASPPAKRNARKRAATRLPRARQPAAEEALRVSDDESESTTERLARGAAPGAGPSPRGGLLPLPPRKASSPAAAGDAAGDASEASESSAHEARVPPGRQTRRRAAAEGSAAATRSLAPARGVPPLARGGREACAPRGSVPMSWGSVAEERPQALVGRAQRGGEPWYEMVHRLRRGSARRGCVWVGVLRREPDGLFRPTPEVREVALGLHFPRLVRVRCEWGKGADAPASARRGWRVLTTLKRILM